MPESNEQEIGGQEGTEGVAKNTATKRVHLDDFEFYQVCEGLAKTDNFTKEAIAEATGLTVNTVTQRRNRFNATYKEAGFRLTDLPKGSKKGKQEEIANTILRLKALKDQAEQEAGA